MYTVLIIIHLIVVLALIGVVLLQKSEGGALGMGGGGGGFMSSRGSGNALTRATAILAGIFFVTSLLLSYLAGAGRHDSIFQGSAAPTTRSAPGTTAPAPGAPGTSILDQIKGAPATTPATPPAPSGPQVPQSK